MPYQTASCLLRALACSTDGGRHLLSAGQGITQLISRVQLTSLMLSPAVSSLGRSSPTRLTGQGKSAYTLPCCTSVTLDTRVNIDMLARALQRPQASSNEVVQQSSSFGLLRCCESCPCLHIQRSLAHPHKRKPSVRIPSLTPACRVNKIVDLAGAEGTLIKQVLRGNPGEM
jgi:hypothetical protein